MCADPFVFVLGAAVHLQPSIGVGWPCRAWHPRVRNKTEFVFNVFVHFNKVSGCARGTVGSRLGTCDAWTAGGCLCDPGVVGAQDRSALTCLKESVCENTPFFLTAGSCVSEARRERREQHLGLGFKVLVL